MPTILTWPAAIKPSQMTVHLQALTSRFESPFTRATQTQELAGGRFQVSASLAPMDQAKTRILRAFLAKLRGGAGRFYWPAEARALASIPAFEGTDASASALTADSTEITADRTDYTADATTWFVDPIATASTGGTSTTIVATTNPLLAGEVVIEAGRHLSFDTADGWRQLCIVTDDAIADGDGGVTITVEPPMRTQPASGAPLHLRAPSGVFMLRDDDQGQIVQSVGLIGQTSIEAVEAFPLRLPA